MLVIRKEQIEALEKDASKHFVSHLCSHCEEFSPHLCKTLKKDELRNAVEYGVERAKEYGFDLRGPVRYFVDLMIVLGSGFDTDPQYPWAAEALRIGNPDEEQDETEEQASEEAEGAQDPVSQTQYGHEKEEEKESPAEQMERSEALSDRVSDYLKKVDGKDNVHTLDALRLLSARYREGIEFRLDGFDQNMIKLMKETHPRKVEETGEEALLQLISDARKKATERYSFTKARSLGLMCILMFAFGHQCDSDPFLPWISRTLDRTGEEDPEVVAEDLEKRALIWLDAVLKNFSEVA